MHQDCHLKFVYTLGVAAEGKLDLAHERLSAKLGPKSVERVYFDKLEVGREEVKSIGRDGWPMESLLSVFVELVERQVVDIEWESVHLEERSELEVDRPFLHAHRDVVLQDRHKLLHD